MSNRQFHFNVSRMKVDHLPQTCSSNLPHGNSILPTAQAKNFHLILASGLSYHTHNLSTLLSNTDNSTFKISRGHDHLHRSCPGSSRHRFSARLAAIGCLTVLPASIFALTACLPRGSQSDHVTPVLETLRRLSASSKCKPMARHWPRAPCALRAVGGHSSRPLPSTCTAVS